MVESRTVDRLLAEDVVAVELVESLALSEGDEDDAAGRIEFRKLLKPAPTIGSDESD
jgi:hypothetical protein